MKTEVFLERPLLDGIIRQSNTNEYLNVNDLLLIGNRWRINNELNIFRYEYWYNLDGTREFLQILEQKIGKNPIISKRGKSGERWLHPFAFIDLALHINPNFKLEVYSWIYDQLIKYRNDSGDSYKKMSGYLWDNCTNKSTFPKFISDTALKIQKACGVADWQKATEKQLDLRNRMHENIALLTEILRDNNQAVKIGIDKALR